MPRIITLISRTAKPYAVVMNTECFITHNLFPKSVFSDKKKISLSFFPVNGKNSEDFSLIVSVFIHFYPLLGKNDKKII